MNRINSRRARQVYVVIVPVTTVVPKRDELVAVGEQWRPSARKHQPREFVALRAGGIQREGLPFPARPIGGWAGPG